MFSIEEHIDNLVRHIRFVEDNCLLIGKREIARGRIEFGRLLIARGFRHDNSKFYGCEWDDLHCGPDTPMDRVRVAASHHARSNDHHPEYHGGIEKMSEVQICEMVADWGARSQERGTDLRQWIRTEAVERFKIDLAGQHWKWIEHFVDLLLLSAFAPNK